MTELKKARLFRLKRGLTLKAFGNALGVDHTNLSLYERGMLATPEKWRGAIAEALGAPMEELFNECGFAREVSE
jgi:transcriptional regulator with XRE-family HTH domain